MSYNFLISQPLASIACPLYTARGEMDSTVRNINILVRTKRDQKNVSKETKKLSMAERLYRGYGFMALHFQYRKGYEVKKFKSINQ